MILDSRFNNPYKLIGIISIFGPVAQLVMRRIRIAEITGSTPVRSTALTDPRITREA